MNTIEIVDRSELEEVISKLGKAAKRVHESAFHFGDKVPSVFSDDTMVSIDALIGRFTRLAYILIARAIPLIDRLDGLDAIDVTRSLARAEARGLVENAKRLFALPIVRNEFSDEYESYEPEMIASELLEVTPFLLLSVERVRGYGNSFLAEVHE